MFKKLLITLGVLFLLLVIAARVVPSFISEERIKRAVSEKTQEILGYDIAINGSLSFRVFPVAGVYMEDVVVGTGSDKQSQTLATFKSVRVDIETLALINGDIFIKSMLLDTPVIQLVVDKSGKRNWIKNKKPADEIYNSAENIPPITHNSGYVRNVSLEDVRIRDGILSYRDETTKDNWTAKGITIDISLDDMDSPFEIEGRLEYNKQTLRFDTTLSTLSDFINKKRANIEAKIQSNLLNIEASGKIDGGSYIGSTSLTSPSLPQAVEWLTQKPLGTKFSSELPLSITSQTNCSPDMCHFTKALLKLDTMSSSGEVKALFRKRVPTIEMALDTNELDFNLFMSQPEQAGFSLISSAHATPVTWSNKPINFSVLRAIDLTARINAAGIKIKDVTIGRTVFRAKISRGKLSADIIDAKFYGGKATIMTTIDASGKRPTIEKRINFKNIQMENFLKDAKITDRFTGKTDFTLALISSGNSEQEMISTMQGAGSIKCNDGAITGINIAQMLRNVQSAFKEMDTSEQRTDFSEMGGTFTIKNGILSNNDLLVKAPLFRATGTGVANLSQQNLKYRITPQIVRTAQGQGGKTKKGIGVPIIISGSFDNLKYRPDLKSTIQQIVKNPKKAKKIVKNIKKEMKKNKVALKGLLKQLKNKK